MPSMLAPHKTLELWHRSMISTSHSLRGALVTVWSCAYMMMGMKMDGRSFLSRMLVRGSNTAYDTKKMVRLEL